MAEIPLFAKTAVLDSYLSTDPRTLAPEIVDTIAKSLRKHKDLYSYFFRYRPQAEWARLLEPFGYFETAPELTENNGNFVATFWAEQEFLISVSPEVPEVVVDHIRKLKGHPYYFGRAMVALQNAPSSILPEVLPELLEWLDDIQIAQVVGIEILGLIQVVAKEQRELVFTLFEKVTAPISPSGVPDDEIGRFLRARSYALFPLDDYAGRTLPKTAELLQTVNPWRTIDILEKQFREAIQQELKHTGTPTFTFWRSSIEPSGQDRIPEYKGLLLDCLRDAVEYLGQVDEAALEKRVEKYLTDESEIIRRLGVHLLRKFPVHLRDYVGRVLLDARNLDDLGLHHEFFNLLKDGFPVLDQREKRQLVSLLLLGPPTEKSEDDEELSVEEEKYRSDRREFWIRDRLWMLKDFLESEDAAYLDSLIAKWGKPEHPDFTHWIGNSFFVSNESPVTADELSQKSNSDLIRFLSDWKPAARKSPSIEESHGALGVEVARLVESNRRRYEPILFEIARLHSGFATHLVKLSDPSESDFDTIFHSQFDLFEKMLSIPEIRESIEYSGSSSWISFRFAIVSLIEKLIQNENWTYDQKQFRRVVNLLILLANDPDPDMENDQPGEGWFGHNDPLTVAINHVRPLAVAGLIRLLHRDKAKSHKNGNSVTSPELQIKSLMFLSKKADQNLEMSLSVHSVFGRYLQSLYWIDAEWTVANIERIFPSEESPTSIAFFVSAWDSWIATSVVDPLVFGLLRPKYERAIDNLSNGFISKTFSPVRGLAEHLLLEYENASYKINSPEGANSLIAKFFNRTLPEHRGTATWTVAQRMRGNQDKWNRVKDLWLWRLSIANEAKHNLEFKDEMSGFSGILDSLPSSESISTMRLLLEGFLPYLGDSSSHDRIWHNLEQYLAREVSRDPLGAIKFYNLMHDHITTRRFFYPPEATKIVTVASEHPQARRSVIDLIDKQIRQEHYELRELQQKLLDGV